MVIKKIFNNNAVLVENSEGSDKKELVVMGCGIAFKKSIGEKIDKQLIEKTFILKHNETSEKFKLLLEHVPAQYVSLCYDIIEYAKNMLGVKLNDYVYVTLTDHINYALNMFESDIINTNALIWEIKKFYPKEFKVGLKALEFIEDETGKRLTEDEAGNIALHLINAQISDSTNKVENVVKQTKMIQDILSIIKYTYNITFDEESLDYERFVTHLRFFFQRLNQRIDKKAKDEDDFLFMQVKDKYKGAYDCMLKVGKYLEMELSEEEQLYLTIHIQRLSQV